MSHSGRLPSTLWILKINFLIATASATRVSEPHALCMVPSFLIQKPCSFMLTTNLAFLPQTAAQVAVSSDIELSAFYPSPQNDLEPDMQIIYRPVHALHASFQHMQPLCSDDRAPLFPWDEGRV